MAEWIYDLDGSYVWEERADGWPDRIVAESVRPEDGPRIAEAPAMEYVIRRLLKLLVARDMHAHSMEEASAILSRIDAGRKDEPGTDVKTGD